MAPLLGPSIFGENANVRPEDSQPVFKLLETIAKQLEINTEVDPYHARCARVYRPDPAPTLSRTLRSFPPAEHATRLILILFPLKLHLPALRLSPPTCYRVPREKAVIRARWPWCSGASTISRRKVREWPRPLVLGVRPVRDGLNRVTQLETIPLAQLKRPRIDVVMTISGIFRDLFSPTVELLDKAVRLVAGLDEPLELNYVRRNVLEQMDAERCEFDDAAVRVFSNAPGNYGTNVNFMVMDSQWDKDETLGDLFVTRKCFAYGRDSRGRSIEGREARLAMDRALSRVEATYQNIDTFEIGITDVDHYFEYLGGISKAVEKRAQARPEIYLSDSLSPDGRIRTLEETVRLETRAKTLNPKWYEGMLRHGFRGVAEIENHVANTFGWSATADAVDDWVYDEVAKTFLLDQAMLDRLRELNPHSAHSLAKRLLEANGRGYWEADPTLLDELREIVGSLEDQLEGVS